MRKHRYAVYVVYVVFFTSSCTINASFQGLFSYYNKTKSLSPQIFDGDHKDLNYFCTENINALSPKIILSNGLDLRYCLSSKDKSIVYVWGPNCRSGICYSLNLLQYECNKRGIDLFILSEYYDSDKMLIPYDIHRPIIGVDVKYYRSNLTDIYMTKFLNELIGGEFEYTGERILYFEGALFENSFSSIEELDSHFSM